MGDGMRVLGIVPISESAFGWLLAREGYDVRIEQTVDGGLNQLNGWKPHAVILDWDMLGDDAARVCTRIATEVEADDGAVIGISADVDREAPCEALLAGAIAFLRKPLDALELFCRLRSHLGRLDPVGPETVQVGDVLLDARNHVAKKDGASVALTPSECSIFQFLMTRPGRAVGVETLLVEALGYPARLGNPEIVRTHVRNLRQKLEEDPRQPRFIVNIPRVGYVLRP